MTKNPLFAHQGQLTDQTPLRETPLRETPLRETPLRGGVRISQLYVHTVRNYIAPYHPTTQRLASRGSCNIAQSRGWKQSSNTIVYQSRVCEILLATHLNSLHLANLRHRNSELCPKQRGKNGRHKGGPNTHSRCILLVWATPISPHLYLLSLISRKVNELP